MFLESFNKLKLYCESQDYSGWDPYDGLNSKIFQALPIKHWDLARLAWIQGFKRIPFNFRPFLLVPKQHNAKGIGLFLSGYCNIFNSQVISGREELGKQEKIIEKIHYLADLLISMRNTSYSEACWGYNFDWQARRLFLFPKNTPTVVATCFCATSLFQAYEVTRCRKYLENAISAGNFVLKHLQRTYKKNGFLFSYSPLDGNNSVYNASLLGSKLLSQCFHYTSEDKYKQSACESVIACIDAQNSDGSWIYGELPVQNWIDSFHTGYNLDALMIYRKYCNDSTVDLAIQSGFNYYIENFFLPDGTPKYYNNETYPIDIHCPAQLFVTLSSLGKFQEYNEIAGKVMRWTLKNMQDKTGYFYYQIKRNFSSKISYMRWSNAFMFYAMSFYYLELERKSHEKYSG